MGQWNNAELHKHQADAEQEGGSGGGLLAPFLLKPGAGGRKGWDRWRPMLVPVLAMVLGLLLVQFSPIPGLGVFLIIGGSFVLCIAALQVLLGL